MGGKVVAIVPAYNEQENVELVIKCLHKAVDAGAISDFLIIANGCTDWTYLKSLRFLAKAKRIPVANKGLAFIEGVKWANKKKADVVVTIDADAAEFSPRAIKKLTEPVLAKRTPMSISGFCHKSEKGTFNFPTYLSGFRAVSMKALKPLFAENRDWIDSITSRRYSLEIALNAKIFGLKHRKLLSNTEVKENGKSIIIEENKLIADSLLPPLFAVRRTIRDDAVRDEITHTHGRFRDRLLRAEMLKEERKKPFSQRKLRIRK